MGARSRTIERDEGKFLGSTLRRANSLRVRGVRKQAVSETLPSADGSLAFMRTRESSTCGRMVRTGRKGDSEIEHSRREEKIVKKGRQSNIMKKVDRKRKNMWRSPTPGPNGGLCSKSRLCDDASDDDMALTDSKTLAKETSLKGDVSDQTNSMLRTSVLTDLTAKSIQKSGEFQVSRSGSTSDEAQISNYSRSRGILRSNCARPQPKPRSTSINPILRESQCRSDLRDMVLPVPKPRKPMGLSYVNIQLDSPLSTTIPNLTIEAEPIAQSAFDYTIYPDQSKEAVHNNLCRAQKLEPSNGCHNAFKECSHYRCEDWKKKRLHKQRADILKQGFDVQLKRWFYKMAKHRELLKDSSELEVRQFCETYGDIGNISFVPENVGFIFLNSDEDDFNVLDNHTVFKDLDDETFDGFMIKPIQHVNTCDINRKDQIEAGALNLLSTLHHLPVDIHKDVVSRFNHMCV